MEFAAHFSLERLVDELVLLDTGLAAEAFGDNGRRVMIAVTGEIADRDLGIRQTRPDYRVSEPKPPVDIRGVLLS